MNTDGSDGMNTEYGQQESSTGTAQRIAQRTREAKATVGQKARETKERIISQGGERVRQAKDQTRAYADERKNQLGERIHHYGSAVRRAADKLRDEQDPNIAHYAESIAERIDEAADYVQSRDPGMIMRDVENIARRRPEIFFGGMFFAGLMLSRFLKASGQRDEYEAAESENYWVEDGGSGEMEMEMGAAPEGTYSIAPASESGWEESSPEARNPQGNI